MIVVIEQIQWPMWTTFVGLMILIWYLMMRKILR